MRIFWILILLFSIAATIAEAQIARQSFHRGTAAARAGNFETALEHFQQSLRQSQIVNDSSTHSIAQTHYNIGVCFYHLRRFDEAVENYRQAIKLRDGDYQKAVRALAMAEIERKNWLAAKLAFERAIDLAGGADGESWFDLAMIFVAEKDFVKAEKCFRKALRHKTIAAAASRNNLGVILALKNDFAAAETEFETALQLSAGKFGAAKRNLEFCRARATNVLLAKLEFSREKLIFNEE